MHVFHNIHDYGKRENTPDYRKYFLTWPDKQPFEAGYVDQQTVYVNDSIEPHSKDFEQSQMLVLTDYTTSSSYHPICDQLHCRTPWHSLMRDFQHPRHYSIFDITKIGDAFQIHLNYKDNGAYIGIPHRDDFMVAELKVNEPLRITINGKSDFTMTGRKARTFYLLDYIFVYYGEFSQFQTVPANRLADPRPFSFVPTKHVDLQKILR